jgi:hypothetical protein
MANRVKWAIWIVSIVGGTAALAVVGGWDMLAIVFLVVPPFAILFAGGMLVQVIARSRAVPNWAFAVAGALLSLLAGLPFLRSDGDAGALLLGW